MCILNFILPPNITPTLSLRSNIVDTDFSCIASAQDHFLQFYTVNIANPVISSTKIEKTKQFS